MANKNFLYVIPLLTLLSVSPGELLKKESFRAPASVEVETEVKEEKKFERFEAMISQVDSKDLLVSESVSKDKFKEKSQGLQSKIQEELEKFNSKATDKEEITKQRESIESLVVDKVILDKEFDVLDEKKELDEELKKELLLLSDSHKESLEKLLVHLAHNEELLQEAPRVADGEVKPEDQKEEDKKEEDKKDDPKVASDSSKDDKKEDSCEAGQQVKVLSTQVEKLMEQQNLILQAMLNLTQAMVNMSQNMQQSQPYFPMPQTAYQYHQPMAQGNWVYYPQGHTPQMNQSFYPNQVHQNQMPQMNQQPQLSLMNQMPAVGQFGMGPQQGLMNSFNFSSPTSPLL